METGFSYSPEMKYQTSKNNKISIIVPVYGVEQFVSRCLASIDEQTYRNYTLILVDDGSTDNSPYFCDEWANLFSDTVVIHQSNSGLSAARNSGIDLEIKCDDCNWITFIDSDDWIHSDYLNLLIKGAVDSNSLVSVCDHIRVESCKEVSNKTIDALCRMIPIEQYWVNNRTNATTAWGKIYNRKLFEDIRYPIGAYHEDEYVTYRILFFCKEIAHIEAPLYYYYQNNNSISNLNYIKRFPDIIKAFEMHYDYFSNSAYKDAFRLETEKLAESLANILYYMRKEDKKYYKKEIKSKRKRLRFFLRIHNRMIPYWIRKDIYIQAYPALMIPIRVVGYIKALIEKNKERKSEV